MTADLDSLQPGDGEPFKPIGRAELAAIRKRFNEVQKRRGEGTPKAMLNRKTKRRRGEW